MKNNINVVFMGTPDFAVPSLKKLIEEFNVLAVVTQPDRPKGRGKKLFASPVKEVALQNNIEVYQPEKIKKNLEIIQKLKELKPDFIIVVAFGQILPKEVIDIPKYGCINLHASLLPQYRGAAPINWAIIKGEKVSGNTTMFMDTGLDTGDILLTDTVQISQDMNAGDLHDILMVRGAVLLTDTVKGVFEGKIERKKQPNECEFYASMLDKEIAKIDWNLENDEINCLVRGLNPWPIAYTLYKGLAMKIHSGKALNRNSQATPGQIIKIDSTGIEVATGRGIFLIEKIQFPGGKPLKVQEYIKGHTMEEILLGE